MRTKRVFTLAVAAVLTLALCVAALPKGALAALESVSIRGAALTSTTPYGYWDGGTFRTASSRPSSPWQAHLTVPAASECMLELWNLSLGTWAADNSGISADSPIGAVTKLTLSLQGVSEITQNAGSSDKPAISCPGVALRITGGGSLSAQSPQEDDPCYGIQVGTGGSVSLDGGAALVAAGRRGAIDKQVALDWSKYTVMGRTNLGDPDTDNEELTQGQYARNWASYQYLSFTPIPTPEPVPAADVPKTGDGAPLALLCGLMLLSGTGLLASGLLRRREN